MITELVDASSMSGGEDALRVLRYLARKAAAAGVLVTTGPEGLDLRLPEEAAGPSVKVRVAAGLWQLWQTKGWVALRPEAGVWHLTARGRQHLRRLLSSSTDAANPKRLPSSADTLPAPVRPGINLNESPIGWLARRRDKSGEPMISSEQFAAAERLRADFWFAGMSPRVTTNWAAAASGGRSGNRMASAGMSDNALAAATRVRHAVSAVGPELASLLIDVCCHLNGLEAAERKAGWPLRSAKVVLQLALTRLARHYGLLAPVKDPARETRAHIRHWGAADYRPRTGSGGETV